MLDKDDRDEIDRIIANHEALKKLSADQQISIFKMFGIIFSILAFFSGLGLISYFVSTVDDNIREKVRDISELRVAEKLLENGNFIQRLSVRVAPFPDNAIIAFNDPQGCPDGWVEYVPARGRAIIGANPEFDQSADVSSRKFNERGGSEFHELKVEEMPSHSHAVASAARASSATRGGEVPILNVTQRQTSEVGKGEPHNNMPPFIALFICERRSIK